MQSDQCFNSSPTCIALLNDTLDCNDLKSFIIHDDTIPCEIKLNYSWSQPASFVGKRNVVSLFKPELKQQSALLARELNESKAAVATLDPPKAAVYTSALQAFMQQLLAEQTCTPTMVVNDDPMLIVAFHNDFATAGDDTPELQESYSSSNDHIDDEYIDVGDILSSFGDFHMNSVDVPPLIDMKRNMRSVM
jgi:hypothetical protein